ncbi:MAG: helix-turn-helix domain-containing protein [Nanoarchaeota archaeon]|nr:helix-turn-helix domain-containing protein [Nanoarchaeota archaeon]
MKNDDESTKLAHLILNAVDNLKVGRHKLASFLKGSKSKLIVPISQQAIFGGLYWHDIPTIEGYIDQLENMELIRRTQVDPLYSYYVLTEAGRKAVDEKIEIPLQVIKQIKPVTVGDSEKETLAMFRQGKSITEIANERGLVRTTIYMHLYKLIVNGYLKSNEIMVKERHDEITKACEKFKNRPSLSEIKALLPDEITYEEIRCVAAEYWKEK